MSISPSSWPADDDQSLRELWSKGLPSVDIGRILHRTKNSIIGRAHRLNLERRQSIFVNVELYGPPTRATWRDRVSRAAQQERRDVPSPKQASTLPPLKSGLEPHPKPTVLRIVRTRPPAPRLYVPQRPLPPTDVQPPRPERVQRPPVFAGACCWPIGEPRAADFRFCDEPLTTHRNYCEQHHSIGYVRRSDPLTYAAD
jgi:GcrA cell cycle regulator